MKRHGDREGRTANLLVCCAWLLLSGLLLLGCTSREEPVDYVEILSRIHVGEGREQALQALSDAWYHSECRLLYGDIEDILLYGPRVRDKVTIISIYSKSRGERLVVDHTGTYENYFLDAPDFGQFCEPPVQNAFEPGTVRATQNP
jgi:hypothetical protein